MAVMARLLVPADFGLVAIANVSLRFFSYFSQMGITPALIQKPKIEVSDVRAAMALSLGVSGFFFFLAVSAAGFIEGFFEISGLGLVTQILALNFVIGGFSAVSTGLLRRQNEFKKLALIEIVSYVLGYGLVGLGAAYIGAGVWALVAAFLTQISLTALLSYAVTRHSISLKHTKEQRAHFISYGGRYSIIGFIEFLSSNIDALIIGKLLGATPAGYYNRALLLANLPVQQPANVLTKVLFPIMSSIGDQHDKQSMSLQLSVLLVGSYAFAVGAGIYVAASDIVKVLLGDKWLDTIPTLQILAWSVGPLYISHVAGVTLDSMAKLAIKMRIQLSMLTLLVLLLLLTSTTGTVRSIALAVVVTEWVRVFIMGWILIRLLSIYWLDVIKILSAMVVVAIMAGYAILAFNSLFFINESNIIRLIGDIISGGFGLSIGLIFALHIVSKNQAILFLADRQPRFSKFLNKFNSRK